MDTPRPVPAKQAAKEVNVSYHGLLRKIKEGKLPAYWFGRKVMVDVNEVLTAMRQGSK